MTTRSHVTRCGPRFHATTIALASLCLATNVAGQCEFQKLTPWDATGHDDFGASISITLDTALIGAPTHDHPVGDAGAAYVLRYDGTAWVEEQELVASDAAFGDLFGAAVVIEGDVAIVGAVGVDDPVPGSGALYVFERTGGAWVERQKLTTLAVTMHRSFGDAIALDGNVMVAGASHEDPLGLNSGAAYIFRFDGASWVEEQRLVPRDGAAQDYFGSSVAISGEVIVVGAWGDDDSGSKSGSAYVFRDDGTSWIQEQKLVCPEFAPNAYFSSSIAIDGGVALLGAPGHWSDGFVSVYHLSGGRWLETSRLIPSDSDDRGFGRSVVVEGDVALVGAAVSSQGAAYVFLFDGTTWTEQRRLVPTDEPIDDWFGSAVGLRGNLMMVGGKGQGPSPGSVYAYDLVGEDCNGNGLCDRTDILLGDSQDCDQNAVPDECDLAEPYADCNRNDIPDACDIDDATSKDLNGNGLPDECELDCDGDGVFDFIEIEDGTSEDCNGNFVPDECEPCVVVQSLEIETDDAGFGYGTGVDLHGDTAVISEAPGGRAHVFRRDGGSWIHLTTLEAGGHDAAIHDDLIVAGDPFASEEAGEVHVFRRDGTHWVEEAVLTASDAAPDSFFGWSVAVGPSTIVVGAWRADDMGAVYVFTHDGSRWSQSLKLVAEERQTGAQFGHVVKLDDAVIAVGAPYEEPGGVAYIFRFDGSWPQEARLTSSLGADAAFGGALAVRGSTVAVGSGEAAHVFTYLGSGVWGLDQVLDDDVRVDALAIDGETVLVGTGEASPLACDPSGGAIHVYRHDNEQFVKLATLVERVDGILGHRVVADENVVLSSTVVIGFPSSAVAVVAYHGIDDCDADGQLDICQIQRGMVTDSDGDGIPDACQCLADFDDSGDVAFPDLVALLSAWGTCAPCSEDLDGDGDVGFSDLLALLTTWGACFDTGACCLPTGTCFITDRDDDCAALGGSYLGDDTLCADVTCPQPGACCLPDGVCEPSTVGGAACVAQGGVYLGDDISCEIITCPEPGACCRADGTCDLVASLGGAGCASQGGVYLGDDTVCEDAACPEAGACCLPEGGCVVLFEGPCVAAGGSYVGDGVPCELVDCTQGACCLPSGSCQVVPPEVCDAVDADYQGDGLTCEIVICP